MNKTTLQSGISILGVIFLGVIIILILSYFNISIRGVVESPTGQDNVHYVGGATQGFWNKYLKQPVLYFWNEIWIKLFWDSFKDNLQRIRAGVPTDIDNAAVNLQIQTNQSNQ